MGRFSFFVAAGLALTTVPARATPVNLISNGGFETTSMSTASQMTTTNVSNWSTTGYNFVFFPGSTSSTGSYGALSLWQEAAIASSDPAGGNFVGADGAFGTAAITQTVSGLTVGHVYALSFYWGGAQQAGYNGITTEQWSVSLGSETHSTNILTDASNGFTGWNQATMLFTATATSEMLSFLAAGTPNGQPPFSVLDGVTMVDVPEPASLALLAVGVLGIAHTVRRRRRL